MLSRAIQIQTPWLTVMQKTEYENDKFTLLLLGPEAFLDWLKKVEELVKTALGDFTDTFSSSVSAAGWKVNVNPSCVTYGPPVAKGGQVCLLLDILGGWLWKGMSGLKIKLSQLKHLSCHIPPPTPKDQECDYFPDTSTGDLLLLQS